MSAGVDFQILVQQKLFSSESCTCCILASLVEEGHKQNRLVSLVEGQGEYGLFLYAYDQKASKSATDLSLDAAFPVSSDFKFNLEAGPPGANHVIVRISHSNCEYRLEIPNNEVASIFLAELKQAITIQSQNSGFGLPSTFAWMDKYKSSRNSSDTVNPFAGEGFDDGWPWNQIASTDNNIVVVDHFSEESVTPNSSLPESQQNVPRSSSNNNFNGSSRADSAMFYRQVSSSGRSNFYSGLDDDSETNHREYKVRMAMKVKEDEYSKTKFFRVFCGTWNVNGQAASQPCDKWLYNERDKPPDIYAIGFQELDLSKNAYIFSESAREEEWDKRVKDALDRRAEYKKIRLVRLVGMMLAVFAKKEHLKHIHDVESATVATGIMGMLGNKGGVGVRFEFYNTTLCFVNTHLAAHVEEVERRNQDFKNVSSHMSFTKGQPPLNISDHDVVFWIGDLNYRLSGIEINECKALIDKKDYQKLMNYDQLCKEIAAKRVFMEYLEGKITFPPTYKYDPGTDNWDSSEKNRPPAWCDRILWRGSNLSQVAYRSHSALKISDHKPVSALFDTGIKIIDHNKYRQVYEAVMKNLDKLENEYLPQVSLSKTEVTFANVKFAEPKYEIIAVTNTGKVPLRFEFINKGADKMFCKPWLTAEPNAAEISVGHVCDIRIEVLVDPKIAASLSSNSIMEDILVLHLHGGKDLFISVSGSYIPSCFGSSLETLVSLVGPIREVPVANLIDLGQTSEPSPLPGDSRPFDIPKEVYRLVDHLYKYGMDQEDLFQVQGSHKEILQIRDCLDTGVPATIPGTIHSVAEALVNFLQALPEPVIPTGFHPKCLKNPNNPVLCKQALVELPMVHHKLFVYICAFLRKLLEHSANNKLEVNALARQFGQLLLRRRDIDIDQDGGVVLMEPTREEILEDTRKKATFLRHFLTKGYDI